MIKYFVEQYLPCQVPEIIAKVERKILVDLDSALYLNHDLDVYELSEGFYVECPNGQFFLESIDLLQKINGENANDICQNENDFIELEQYYYYNIIGYDILNRKIILHETDAKYKELYKGIKTTWFSYIPLKIEIDLTNKCNFNCVHCSRDASPLKDDEMELQDWISFFKEAGKIGVNSVSFMGGEPTYYPELIEMALIAKMSGIKNLSTSTNCWLVDERLARKMAKLFNSIQVSIHGCCSDTHDKIVGRAGAFSKACEAIKMFKENNVRSLNISFTVMKENENEMAAMIQLAKSLGVSNIRFLFLFARGRGKSCEQWNKQELTKISNNIWLLHKNEESIKIDAGGCPPFKDIRNDAAFYGCPAGRTLMYVSSDGIVKPCCNTEITIGKIQESDILSLWHNKKMISLRQRLQCNCQYVQICAGACLGNENWEKIFKCEVI